MAVTEFVWYGGRKTAHFPLRLFMGQPNHISGMARVFKDYTDLQCHPAEAGLNPEGWKAEARPRRENTLPYVTEITLICCSGSLDNWRRSRL